MSFVALAVVCGCVFVGCSGEPVGSGNGAVQSACGVSQDGQTFDGYPTFPNNCGNIDIWSTNGKDTNNAGHGFLTDTAGYQCVELAARYFHFRWSVDFAGISQATDLCGKPQNGFHYTSSPAPGDLMVFPAYSSNACQATEQWGHVAVVDSVSGGTVDVSQQNIFYGGVWHPRWSGAASCAQCYLHADANHGASSDGQPGDAVCPSSDSGYYICGKDGISAGDANTLYYCNGTNAEPVQNCFLGCRVAPTGENDWCDGTGSSDPDVGTATLVSGSEYDHAVTGDWAPYYDKGTCTRGSKPEVPSQAMTGLSMNPAHDGKAHDVLCEQSSGASTWRAESCSPRTFDQGDDRGDDDGGWDWDYGYNKGECGAAEYAVGVSQGASGVHSLDCCHGNVSHGSCTVRTFNGGDDRAGGSISADWDKDHWKGECEQGHYVAGVSRDPATGAPHAILCCTP